MLDQDIRQALRARACRLHANDPEARIVEELDLGPTTRADVVVLNGRIEGYEIKSDHDRLLRLAHQVAAYEAVCDRVWLVTTDRFADEAAARLPAWWGILVAHRRRGEVVLARRRVAKPHRQLRVRALLELLWRRELLAMCEQHTIRHERGRATVVALRDAIAGSGASRRQVAYGVRSALLTREGWRAVPPSAAGDEPSRPSAKWSGFRSALPPHRRR